MIPGGTRVQFHPMTRPKYLAGALATVIQKQPGEERYLVQIDADPALRRFCGGTWCVDARTIEPVDDPADEKGRTSAEKWLAAIAPRIEREAEAWMEEEGLTEEQREQWRDIWHPQLMWRFFHHLGRLCEDTARGWETIYHTNAHAAREDEQE